MKVKIIWRTRPTDMTMPMIQNPDHFWRRVSAAALIAMWAGFGALPGAIGALWDDLTRYADYGIDWIHIAKILGPAFLWAAYREAQKNQDLLRVPDWASILLKEQSATIARLQAGTDVKITTHAAVTEFPPGEPPSTVQTVKVEEKHTQPIPPPAG